MYRYHGLLIAEYQDEDGLIEVVDKDGTRQLHFGSPAQQSSMALHSPGSLQVQYERAMMGCLLLNPAPRNALLIGLGGGSLAKFLLDQLEHTRVHVVEQRALVVEVAHKHFAVERNARLQIDVGCGAEYVASQAKQVAGTCDLILVDAYRSGGMATEVASEAFFRHCQRLLSDKGMLVINLWRSDKAVLTEVTRHLTSLFAWRAHFIPVQGQGNLVGFALASGFPRSDASVLEARARELQQRMQLDFPAFLQELSVSDPMQTLFTQD